MFTASAYSFRQKSRLAISLSWVAGYTNVVTFILCGGVVVAHVTGNVTHLGLAVADQGFGAPLALRQLGYYSFLVLCFLSGAVGSALLTELAKRANAVSHYTVPVVAETFLLFLLGVGAALHTIGVVSLG
ncbi:DUF1275 family protein, partial [Bradyrhizobium sp. NBAIM08]|uniref:DUF1275 family protein n=1 Tax=Bradyrhizobium sp. NBAIM08 TaxID=2793815 RepID=UPI001CD3EB1A